MGEETLFPLLDNVYLKYVQNLLALTSGKDLCGVLGI